MGWILLFLLLIIFVPLCALAMYNDNKRAANKVKNVICPYCGANKPIPMIIKRGINGNLMGVKDKHSKANNSNFKCRNCGSYF